MDNEKQMNTLMVEAVMKALRRANIPVQSVVSSADGTNILNNLESLALEYIEKSKNNTRTFLGDLANALNIPNRNKSSRYGLFKTINENIISIRLSNHNATVSNFDNAGDKDELN